MLLPRTSAARIGFHIKQKFPKASPKIFCCKKKRDTKVKSISLSNRIAFTEYTVLRPQPLGCGWHF